MVFTAARLGCRITEGAARGFSTGDWDDRRPPLPEVDDELQAAARLRDPSARKSACITGR